MLTESQYTELPICCISFPKRWVIVRGVNPN